MARWCWDYRHHRVLDRDGRGGGGHPGWPYLLFSVLAVLGAAIYLAGRNIKYGDRHHQLIAARATAPPDNQAPNGQFIGLVDGARWHSGDLVSGSVIGVPPKTEPWLLIRDVRQDIFRPQKLFLDMHDRFRVPVHLNGSNSDDEFLLLLVLIGARVPFSDPMQNLPPGVRILDQRTVKLTFERREH